MELKLIVLEGAKQGTEIPLKKDKFFIGRAKECNLRAGSEAISRRHCAITRSNGQWMVRDLGSRNGTHVNETKIDSEVALNIGDELRVGPLKFRIATLAGIVAQVELPAIPPLAPPADVEQRKQPPVKDVADAVQRTVAQSNGAMSEEDISGWLLGSVDRDASETLKETRTISMQETKTLNRLGQAAEVDAAGDETVIGDEIAESTTGSGSMPTVDADKSSGWNIFKRNKSAPSKKSPGKLPPRQEQQTKDSREAAADIIRQMQRRR